MLIALLVLASMSRCVSTELCPSDEELISAVRARDVAIAGDSQARREALEHGISVDRPPPSSLEGVHCGRALIAGRRRVSCSYTLRYPDETIYEGEIFEWDGEHWIIPDAVEAARSVGTIPAKGD